MSFKVLIPNAITTAVVYEVYEFEKIIGESVPELPSSPSSTIPPINSKHTTPPPPAQQCQSYPIARGGYSSVVLATHNTTKVKYAVKIIDKAKLTTPALEQRVQRECELNLRVSHPHIARVFEIYESHEDVCLVMELLGGGELFDLIAAKGKITEESARPLMRAIFDAVHYLHSLGIAHRDLKPENMLFTTGGHELIKLIDFGFAKVGIGEHSVLQTPIGTPAYLAPEVINSESYNKSVDMWAMGCILFFVLVGRPPFYSDDEEEIAEQAASGKYVYPASVKLSESVRSLIAALLITDPAKRVTANHAVHHPWLTGKDAGNSDDSSKLEERGQKDSDQRFGLLRNSINKSIDTMRSETEKASEKKFEAPGAQGQTGPPSAGPPLVASALDNPLFKRKAKKQQQPQQNQQTKPPQ